MFHEAKYTLGNSKRLQSVFVWFCVNKEITLRMRLSLRCSLNNRNHDVGFFITLQCSLSTSSVIHHIILNSYCIQTVFSTNVIHIPLVNSTVCTLNNYNLTRTRLCVCTYTAT